jgi:hypothetical protein
MTLFELIGTTFGHDHIVGHFVWMISQHPTLLVNSKMLSTLALKTIVKARKKPANALDESRSQRLESGARRINQQSHTLSDSARPACLKVAIGELPRHS